MGKLLLALCGLAALLLLASVIAAASQHWGGPTTAELARDYAEAERIARDAELEATWAPVRAAALNLALIAVVFGGLAYLAALGIAHLARFRHERMPRDDGLLPVRASDLGAVAPRALGAYHGARQLEAARQLVPQTLTYTTHYAPHLRAPAAALPGDVVAEAPQLAPAPTFAQLLAGGRVGRGNPLLLGFDTDIGAELVGSWLDLYSTAVSGMPGSGKTTSQRFLACQTALHGARFAICDPHAGAADDSLAATLAPLSAAFVCEPASGDKAILEIVRYVADVGRRRVSGQDRDTTPLILWVDELTSLLGRSSVAGELAELLERVAQEYRKRAVFVCASGQIWTAARTSSELRDSFASVLCHRMKRSQARLLLPTDEAEQAERLSIGQAVLWRTSGETSTVQIPLTTAQDVQRVAGLLATGRPTAQPVGSQIEAPPQPPDMPGGSHVVAAAERLRSASVSAEAARAATMFLEGLDPAAIVWELRQVKSSQGGKYQAALGEVLALIREGLRPA